METYEVVIYSYLLGGLIYGVYYCYYDRKRTREELDQVFREETPWNRAPQIVFYVLCLVMIITSLLIWPYYLVDNAIHEYREAKGDKDG